MDKNLLQYIDTLYIPIIQYVRIDKEKSSKLKCK